MKTTFWHEWKTSFDLVCCKNHKPRFFFDTSNPFIWNRQLSTYFEKSANNWCQRIVANKMLSWQKCFPDALVLLKHVSEEADQGRLLRQTLLVRFVPRTEETDNASKWDAIAVIEEMQKYDKHLNDGKDPCLLKKSQMRRRKCPRIQERS